MKTTLRKCIHFQSAVEELKARGSFDFRCAVAAIAIEANRQIEIFNEAQKPAKGMTDYQQEISLHKENCTEEKEGKKVINVAAFMPMFEKSRAKHAKAIELAEKISREAMQALDNEIEISCKPIQRAQLAAVDTADPLDASLLAKVMPFVE